MFLLFSSYWNIYVFPEIGGIAFSAYLDHDLDLGAHQTIKFNKVNNKH